MSVKNTRKDKLKLKTDSKKRSIPAYIALGFFDGIHLGHQALLNFCVQQAKEDNALSTVLLFETHPEKIVRQLGQFYLLTTLPERKERIKRLGIQQIITIDFTDDFQKISAEDFVKRLLLQQFNMGAVFVGYNYHFGYQKKGNIALLKVMAHKYKFKLYTIGPKKLNGGRKISSTIIKQKLKEGNIEEANRLLGYHYQLNGKVIHGIGRGNKVLSFPTANLDIPKEKLLPRDGVYIAYTFLSGRKYRSLVNIGVRPTFEQVQQKVSVEIYLFNFDKHIYGNQLSVSLICRIRDEKRFPNDEELSRQIRKDKLIAAELFKLYDV